MKRIFLLLLLALYSNQLLLSQADSLNADTTVYLVEKSDGTKYIGKILKDDGREILLDTRAIGQIYIRKSEIKSISRIEASDHKQMKDGIIAEENPFTTRYAFTNNALPIRSRDHYALVNLFGPEIHFAVNNRLNLGLMTTWIGSPFIGAGKYSFGTKNPKINFSIGSMIGSSGYLNAFKGFGGLHWGTFTYGGRKNNLSISAGYGYFSAGRRTQPVPGVYTGETTVYTSSDGSSYTQYEYPIIPYKTNQRLHKAPIFSFAGILQLTQKASLFFDSMIGIGTTRNSTTKITGGPNNYDPNTGVPLPPAPYVATVSKTNKSRSTVLYIMPGMRFYKNEFSAFQVAIAGVSIWENGSSFTFPLPMLSWFFRF
ncbi:MAG: hypothetical protein EP338_12265 [Bacteroidetes bacterium]|nr:MAG: hypothetical protein EP338_12265 [Bacteroidota bacterium]